MYNKKRPNKYRGKGTKSKPVDKREWNEDQVSKNDPKWYVVNDQMLSDVATLSFNNATGVKTYRKAYQKAGSEFPTVAESDFVIPGIMNIYSAPCPGISKDASSAINVASWNLYTNLRARNSGGKNYDHPDLMMYLLAMDSAYAFYAWMTRLYGFAMVYTTQNRYLGQALLAACGVQPSSVIQNLANFRSYINNYALKLSAFCIPNTVSFFERHSWMYSTSFRDEDDVKAQIYMYQPAYLYMYDELSGPGKLVPFELTCAFNSNQGFLPRGGNMGVAAIEQKGNQIIDSLIASEDLNIMSGDILKAYGDSGLWKTGLVPDNYAVISDFNVEVLDQIHNTTFIGGFPIDPSNTTTWEATKDVLEITQNVDVNEGAIIWNPSFSDEPVTAFDPILDYPYGTVEPKRIIVGTRNQIVTEAYTITIGDTAHNALDLFTCGSDICLFPTICVLNGPNGGITEYRVYNNYDAWGYIQTATSQTALVSAFNQHPIFSVWRSQSRKILFTVGEISNYIVLDRDTLKRMHDNALLAMFAYPYLSR